jgi:hypothetical protein
LLALNHFTVPCSFTDVNPLIKSYLMHSLSGNLVGTGRLSLIHQDTAVKRVGNKKRPQVEPAALWYKRRNKSNKRKLKVTQVGEICKARTPRSPRYGRQDAEVALMTVDGTYGGRGILRGVGNNATAQDNKSDGGFARQDPDSQEKSPK